MLVQISWLVNSTKWGPQTIAKLVNKSNNYGLWYLYLFIHLGIGDYKPTYDWGGPHSMADLEDITHWLVVEPNPSEK